MTATRLEETVKKQRRKTERKSGGGGGGGGGVARKPDLNVSTAKLIVLDHISATRMCTIAHLLTVLRP